MFDEAMKVMTDWCEKHPESLAEIRTTKINDECRVTLTLYYWKPTDIKGTPSSRASVMFAYKMSNVNQFVNPNDYLTREYIFHATKVCHAASKDLGEDYG